MRITATDTISLNIRDFPDAVKTAEESQDFCPSVPVTRWSHPDFTHRDISGETTTEVVVLPSGNILIFSWMENMPAIKKVSDLLLSML